LFISWRRAHPRHIRGNRRVRRQISLGRHRGLALGVLMDTFIVRTVLVPCTVILLGRWNWWPSRLSRVGAQPGGPDGPGSTGGPGGPGGEGTEQDTESAAPRAR
jgi:hypothetical protein